MDDILEQLEALDEWDEAVKQAVLDPDLHPPLKGAWVLSGSYWEPQYTISGNWTDSNSSATSSTYTIYFDTGSYKYNYSW